MDSKDRPESNVPAVPPRSSAPRPAVFESMPYGRAQAAEPARSVNVVRAALRAVARHWWQILLLWGVATGVLCYLINTQVKPKYHSDAMLRIEPTHKDIYNTGMYSAENLTPLMQTQVLLIRSPNVLAAALADHKGVAAQPSFAKVVDAEAELRRLLEVSVIPDTYLLSVAWTSESPDECQTIVNAVIDSYLKASADWTDGMTKGQIKRLEEHESELIEMANQKEEQLLELTRKGGIDMEFDNDKGEGRGQAIPTRNRVTVEEYKRLTNDQFETELELEKAESILEVREKAIAEHGPDERLDRKVDQRFQSMPDVAKLLAEMDRLRISYEKKTHMVRNLNDPSLTRDETQYKEHKARYEQLRKERYDEILAAIQDEGADEAGRSTRELRNQVETLSAKKASLKKLIEKLEVTNRTQGTDAVKAALAHQALQSYNQMKESVRKLLQQLRFEQKGEARISLVNPARLNTLPVTDNRKKYLAATPVVVLFTVLAFFVMLELKIGRVSDLEDLSKQMPVEVFALPPLPGPRLEPGQRGSREREARLQEFLQSLDHLRVALYEEHAHSSDSGGRCLIITSATASEGKTTLSAQLSACCAKAGMSVLLVDADMRRATLSRMLNEEKSLGLSDVLQGETSAEEAAISIPDAGFHLLPAGSAGRDPSWLLKGQKIGQLMTRYRQMFDMIIIDTPPILPVPDALTIGRWADGAVLTTRFDVSRFPMVDRARRRLVSAGIPLLTTVVNGVRTSRFYYGYNGYGYGYGYGGYGGYAYGDRAVSPPPESSTPA
jgi:polysaccharide biosynthesis transport protein